MKMIGIIVAVILVIVAAVLIFSPKAPQDVQELKVEDTNTSPTAPVGATSGQVELTDFSYVGYGPGKSHTGTFEEYEVTNVRLSSNGVPVSGDFTIKTASIKTDTALLDTHLKEKPEFFDAVKYPEIKFSLSNATDMGNGEFQVSGNLTVKDVTKKVGFVVNAKSDKTFSSEFRLNMNDFGFKAPGIVEEEVLIKFAGRAI